MPGQVVGVKAVGYTQSKRRFPAFIEGLSGGGTNVDARLAALEAAVIELEAAVNFTLNQEVQIGVYTDAGGTAPLYRFGIGIPAGPSGPPLVVILPILTSAFHMLINHWAVMDDTLDIRMCPFGSEGSSGEPPMALELALKLMRPGLPADPLQIQITPIDGFNWSGSSGTYWMIYTKVATS